jgi:hypothetical protein
MERTGYRKEINNPMFFVLQSLKALKTLLAAGIILLPLWVDAAPNLSRPSGGEFSIFGPGRIVLITLKGKLLRVANPGGESASWALELDGGVKFDGKKLQRIEIDPLTHEIGEFESKRVEIKGRPAWTEGSPERGFYPIIELANIREVNS